MTWCIERVFVGRSTNNADIKCGGVSGGDHHPRISDIGSKYSGGQRQYFNLRSITTGVHMTTTV